MCGSTERVNGLMLSVFCVREYVLVGGVDVLVDRSVSKLKCMMFCLRGLLAKTRLLTLRMSNEHH